MQQKGGCKAGSDGGQEAQGGLRAGGPRAAGWPGLLLLLELVGELHGGPGSPGAVRGLEGQ